jgi:hypothetical protein
MAQNSPLLSQETTRCSITFTAISDREWSEVGQKYEDHVDK